MKSGTTRVVILMLLAAASPASAWICSSNCSCGRGPGYVYANCPPAKRSLTVYNEFRSYVKVTCYENTTDLKLLYSSDMGPVPHVIFKQCPLPQQNYSALLKSMGAQDFSQLDICDSTLSATDLRERLFGLDSVSSLSLNYLGLADVPYDFLKNLSQLKNLDFRDNNLRFPIGFFDHVPNLRTLEISRNNIKYLEPGTFRNLSQLYRLSAWANRLQNLTRETFVGLNGLVGLDLTNNGIQELADDVFAELHNLKVLAMHANNFTYLPNNLFRNTRMLETIRINDNRGELASLPPGLLANLTYLREAYLHRVSLSNLPEDLFHGSMNLTIITLFGNNLKTLPAGLFRDNIRLLKLDLSSNKLEQLPDNIFSTLFELKLLDLSNNHLTKINEHLFANIYNLESLFMRRNAISDVHGLAFFNLQRLRKFDISSNIVSFSNSVQDLIFMSHHVKLDITHNMISKIDLDEAETISLSSMGTDRTVRSITVYLDGNPLNCDCSIYDFLRYLEVKISPEVLSWFQLLPGSLECSSPPMYQGTRVSSLLTEHFLCGCDNTEQQESIRCPKNCTCCAKPHSETLIVDCSKVGLLHAPAELPNLSNLKISHTQLLLQGNNITSLASATQPGYEHVTHIDISHNKLNVLHVDQLPPKLQILHLVDNNLTELNKPVLAFLENRTTVSLQGNPWSCSCKNRDFLSFLHSQFQQVNMQIKPYFLPNNCLLSKTNVLHLRNITCLTQNGINVPLPPMTVNEMCPVDIALILMLGITIGVVGLLLIAIATLLCCYRHKIKIWLYAHNTMLWWITEDELDEGKLLDVFISFSHEDEYFVVKELVPRLEGEQKPFKLCCHFRGCTSGEFIPQQIARSIRDSTRTLVVLSPNFLESVWGSMELRAVHQRALNEGRTKAIFLLYGDIGKVEDLDPEIKTCLRANTYIKWGDPWFWDKLHYALPHRLPKKEKRYHLNTAATSDKMDLMIPAFSTPITTTPPADTINTSFIIHEKAPVLDA
ncbi:hypothetical protein PR048_006273 [Dryococelus australis]|uniref:TIR domain-containing protein n=1 Tax=Dryococelus australis TaxID=614101 RepID=A0ABQ9IAH5_9NEOP|nr:hypothetical protein PR048_006273 [Dryococelus australis]